MDVQLKPHQEAFIEQGVRRGRFSSADVAVQEAVALLEERERGHSGPAQGERKSLAQLFAESPFRGLDMEFGRSSDPLRSIDL